MTRLSNFEDVRDFHMKFGLPTSGNQPNEVSPEVLEFRMKFLLEEVMEFIEGAGYVVHADPSGDFVFRKVGEPDHAQMFDALIDEVYVALGTAHFLGYPWNWGWQIVHEANMAKVRAQSDGSNSLRNSSFDVVKPEGWIAPDIAGLLAECGWEEKN